MKKVKVYLFKAAPESGDHHDHSTQDSTTRNRMVSSATTTAASSGTTGKNELLELGCPPQEVKCQTPLKAVTSSTTEDDTSCREEDRFITFLKSLKIESELVPVLAFQYSNLASLWEHLQHPAQHSGIIFTSPRCVTAAMEAIRLGDSSGDWESSLMGGWASKNVFCVGPSTVSKVGKLFHGSELGRVLTGNESHAESLADMIIDVHSKEALKLPILYPCGSQRRDVLLQKLRGAMINCSELVAYESVKNPLLDARLREVKNELKADTYEAVLSFFSPSGVKYVFEDLDAHLLYKDDVHVVSIGPTTKVALEKHFASVKIEKMIHQCKEPTPAALIDVLSII